MRKGQQGNNINIFLSKIERNIKCLLEEKPELRSVKKRKELIWEYWKRYDGLSQVVTKEMWLYRLTGVENITRSARKVQAKFKKLDDQDRYLRARDMGEYYKSKEQKLKEFSETYLR